MENKNRFLQAATWYADKYSLSVIPLTPGKKSPPLVPWQGYQNQRATLDQIASWWEANPKANVAVVTGKISGICVIDLDTQEAVEKFEAILPDSLETPIAKTPRGGKHYWFAYEEGFNSTRYADGFDIKTDGGIITCPPSCNDELGIRYEWIVKPSECIPARMPASIRAYIKDIALVNNRGLQGDPKNLTYNSLTNLKDLNLFIEGRRDNDLFHIANCLIKGGCERCYIEQTLAILANACSPPFDPTEIPTKINSAMERAVRKERNIQREVLDFINLTETYFDLNETAQTLKLLNSKDKNSLYVAVNKFVKDGIIRKTGRGMYEKVVKDIPEEINPWDASTNELPLKWPLAISDFVMTYPKSIIVVAGESNVGKTAFSLNVGYINRDRMPVKYFSSEMGAIELRTRLDKFEYPQREWKKIKFLERANAFDAVVDPNGLNIIDFLEVHDEFYKVGLWIKQIFDKLEDGVALINIQKNKGRDEGLGGQRGLEKPRLYLSLASEGGKNTCKIVKAKNWRMDTVNPNGFQIDFKLAKGCNFITSGTWRKA